MKQKTKRTQARILQMLAWILSRFSLIVSRLSFFDRRTSNIEYRSTTQSSFDSRYSFVVLRTTNNQQPTTSNFKSRLHALLFVCTLLLGSVQGWGQSIFDWKSDAPDGNWKQGAAGARWYDNSTTNNLWDQPGAGILRFNNNHQLTMTNNVTGTYNQHQIIFGASNTSNRTIGGNTVRLYDFSGTDPKIENQSSGSHTINFNLDGDGTTDPLELNPVSGNLTFGGAVNNRGTDIHIYGDNGNTIRFNGVISGSGKFIIKQNSIAVFNATNTYSGNTELDKGELWIETAGNAVANNNIWLGNSGQTSNVAKFFLSRTSGGTTFSRTINVNAGNSDTRFVGSLNTSGTNTLSGNISRSAAQPLTVQVVNAGGTMTISGIINGSGEVKKTGAGTLILSGNNTYTGNTIITEGTVQLGAANRIANSNFIMSGGTFRTAAAGSAGFAETVGTLQVAGNCDIRFGTGNHSLTFANSSAVSWTNGATLTIYNWSGTEGSTGSAGKLFIGSTSGGLTAAQLSAINFDGFSTSGAMILSTGEIVPRPAPVSIASGNWNSTSTWLNGFVPISTDDVTITSTHTVTVTANASCRSLTFTSSSGSLSVISNVTLAVSQALSVPGNADNNIAATVTGSGAITCSSVTIGSAINPNQNRTTTLTSSISNFTSSGGVTLTSRKSGPRSNEPSLNIGSGILTCTGITTDHPASSGNTATITLATGAQTGKLVLTGTTPFTLDADGTNTVTLNGTGATVEYSAPGAQTVLNRSYTNLTLSGSGNKTMAAFGISGTLSVEGSATPITTAPVYGAGATLQYKNAGNRSTTAIEWPSTNGPTNVIIDNSGSTITTPAANRTLSGNFSLLAGSATISGTVTFNNVDIAGGINFGSASTINGTFTINTGGFVTTNAPTYGASSTLVYATGGTYGRTLEWSATNGAGYPANVTINNGTGLDLGNGGAGTARRLSGNLTVNGGLYMDFESNDMTQSLTVLGNVVIGASAQLSLSDAVGGDIDVKGNWTNNGGTFSPKSRTVTFSGTSDQTITRTGGETFDFLTVNKTGGNLILANNITCNRTLTLTNGDIVTGSNKVTIASGGDITSGTNASHIVGNLERHFATGTNVSRLFPIGDGSNYSPATIILGSVTTAGTITLRTDNSNPYTATYGLSSSKYINRYWTPTNATTVFTGASIQFNYVTGDLAGSAVAGNIRAAGYNGTAWIYPSTTPAANQFTITGITNATIANYYTGGECGTSSFTPSSNTPLCVGATLNLLSGTVSGGAGSYTYSWSGPNGFSSTSQNPSRTNVQTADAGTYTLTVSDAAGCSSSGNATVTVTTPPNAGTISGTQGICVSGTTTFTSDGNSGGAWSTSNAGIANVNSSTGVVSGVAAGSATITYTVTGTGGCSNATATRTVTVTTAPNAGTLSGTQAICVGGSTTFTSNGNSGGTWTTSDVAVATVNSSTGAISGVAAGTATITYTVTGTGGCSNATSTRTVTVTTPPNAGTISGTQGICVSGTTTFTSNGNSGGAWSTSNAGIANVNSSTGVVSGVAAGSATITYTVTGTGGCSNATATRTVTVTAAPNAGTLSGTQAICVGGSTTFTSNGNSGGAWTTSDVAVATVNSSTGAISGVAPGSATITYTVTGTGGCSNATATRTVTVTAPPNAGTISGTQGICVSGTTTFTSNGNSGGAWSTSNAGIANVNSSTGVVTGVAAGSATITYTVTGTGGCSNATATRTVTVTALPSAPTAAGLQTFCNGATVANLVASGTAIKWYTTATGGSEVSSSTALATQYYYASQTVSSCESNTRAAVSVIINAAPSAIDAIVNNATTCEGAAVNLSSTAATFNSTTAVTLLSENFNGTINGWTTVNNSTGGTAADAAWKLRPNAYQYIESNGVVNNFNSNDNTQFYMSNSDDQGSGGTTETMLQSPAFSTVGLSAASLSFFHFFEKTNTGSDIGRVEVSTNGSSWTEVRSYTTDQGNRTGSDPYNYTLTQATAVNLNSYVNNPTVYVRFRYNGAYSYWWVIDNVSVTGTSNRGTGYAWTSSPAGFTASTQNTSASPTVTTTYTVTATNHFGCTSTDNVTVTVIPNNTITLSSAVGTNAQTVCNNTAISNITYTTTGASGATFSGLPAGVTGLWSNNVVTISGTPTATGTFNYTVTLTGGCGNITANGSITVNAANAITLSSAVGTNAQSVCKDVAITNITYNTTTATGATFSGLPAGVSGIWSSNVVTISGIPSVVGTYNYTVTLTGGCTVVTATGSITVRAVPVAYTVTGGGAFCSGEGGNVVGLANSESGVNYQLVRDGATNVGSPVAGTGSAISFGAQTTAGIYTVVGTRTSTNCSVGMSNAVSIAVTSLPNAPTIASITQPTCTVATATINLSGLPAGSWTVIRYPGGVTATGSGTTASYDNLAANTTYTFTVTPNGGCTSPVSANAVVNAQPATPAAPTAGNNSRCGTGTVVLTATVAEGITVDWYSVSSGGTILSGGTGTTSFTTPSISATTSYYAQARSASGGCLSATRTEVVATVNPLPTITASATATSVSYGTASTTLAYTAVTNNPTTYSISWNSTPSNSFAAVTNQNLSGSPISITIPSGTSVGTYTGNLTVTNGAGCTSTNRTFTLTVNTVPLTITGISAEDKVYDGNSAAILTGTPAYVGLVSGETFSVNGTGSASFSNANVGANKTVTITGYTVPSSNYTITQPSLTASITPAPLTITADEKTKSTGSTMSTPQNGSIEFTAEGLIGTETVGTVTLTITNGFQSGAAAGVYTDVVVPSNAGGGTFNPANYSITYVPADLIVGTTIYSRNGGGNWNSTNTWSLSSGSGQTGGSSCGCIPGPTDNVIIRGEHTVTVNVTNAACARLELGGSSKDTYGVLAFSSTGSPKLTVAGQVVVGGSGSTSTNRRGEVDLIGGATLEVEELVLTRSTSGDDAPAIFDMTGGGTLIAGTISVGQGTVTWTPSTGTVVMKSTSTLPSASSVASFNNLTINADVTTTSGRNFSVAGNFTVNGTFVPGNTAHVFSGAGTLTGNGVVDVTLVSTTALTSQYTITNRTLTNLTVEYVGSGNQSMLGTTYGGLVTGGSGTKTMLDNITVNNDVLIGAGTTVSAGSNRTLSVRRNFTNNGTFSPASGTVTLSGSGAQTVSGTSSFFNFTVSNSPANITVANGSVTRISNTFNPGGTSFGNVTGSTIDFNGSNQNIPEFTFFDLAINGGGTKTLQGEVTVTDQLALTSGLVSIGNNDLLITAGNTSAITGGGTGSYVVTGGTGALKYTIGGAGEYSMPVGSASVFNPFNVEWATAPGITRLDVRYIPTTASTGTGLPTNVFGCQSGAELLTNGYWSVSSVGTLTSNPTLNLTRRGHGNAGERRSSHGIVRRNNPESDWFVAGVWTDNGIDEITPATTGPVLMEQEQLNAFGEIAIARGTGNSSIGIWTGALNGNAENSANWGCNTVPTSAVDVVIPRNVRNNPSIINGDIAARNFTIQDGARLIMAGSRSITLSNTGVFTNNGTFDGANTGAVTFQGTGTIAGTSATTFNNVVLNGAVTLTTVPTINGNLQMNDNASVSAAPNYGSNAVLVYNNTNSSSTGNEWSGNGATRTAGLPNTVRLSGSGTISLSGNRSVPGTLELNGGTLDLGSHTLSLFDGLSISGGAFNTSAAGTVSYARTSAGQSIVATNYPSLSFSNFDKTLPASGTIGIAGAFTPGTGTHTTTGSTISFNGSLAQNIPAFNYNNVIVAGSNTKTAAAGLTVAGNVTVSSTFDAGAFSHAIAGNWINNGTFTHGGGTIQFNGTTTISGSAENTFNNVMITGALTAPNTNMNVAGNWSVNGGTFTPGSGTVTFNNTQAPQTISGSASEFSFNNLTVANTGQTISVQGGSPTVPKVLNLAGNMNLNSGALSASFTEVNMTGGNWTNNGAVFTSGSSKVSFTSTTADQLINGTAITQTFAQLTMNKAGRILSLGGSTTTLNITDIFALEAGTYNAGNHLVRIGKNWVITGGTFSAGASTVAFDGESAQDVPSLTYHNLSIQGSGVKSATGNIALNNELNIASGKELDMGTHQLLEAQANSLITTGSGTLRTKNTGVTPLPNGKTWSFGVSFEGAGVQTVSNGTYNGGVTINNSGNGANMNGNVTAASVTLSSGDLSILSNTLTLNGSFNGSSNNALRGSATSNLKVGSNAAAGILYFRNSGTHNFIKDLQFEDAASATLGNRLNVTAGAAAGRVKVEATSSLASNGNLVLKSDTLGTAFVDEIEGCTTCTPITGEVEVERAMPNRRTWRLVTIPVTGNYTLRQQLTRQGPGAAIEYPAPYCNGSPAPAATGYGTMITAHSMSSCGNAAAVGADLITTGGSSSVRRYTHINGTASWASNNTTNAINYNAVPDQEGYLVFIRGDRSQLGSSSNATTFRFKGTLRQGNTASTNSINAAYGVVSNPYAAPINVVDVFANGTDNEKKFARNVWVWDGDKTGSNGFGGYRSLSYDAVNGYTCGDCASNGLEGQQFLTLNSGQAFMLQRKSDVSTAVALTVKEEDKVSGSGNILTMRRFDARTTQSTVPSFRVRLFRANGSNLETFVDATTARFNNLYKADPNEEYDVYKYNNNADENISLVRNNKYLVIESRPVPKANDTLYIPFWSVSNRGYALSIQTENLASTGLTAELIDSFTTTRTPIPLNGTNFVYPFTVSSNAASRSLSRFRVVFTPGNSLPVTFTNVRAYPKSNGVNVEWDVVNEENLSHYEIERSTDGNQFSKIAVKQAENKEAVSYVTFDKKPASGVNYYRIRSVDQDGTFRFSATMRVSLGRNEQGIDVYPTKVSDNNINIALTEQPAGAYNIQLVNSIGQVAFSKRIVHSGGTSTQSLNIGSENLPGGIYYLNIDLENGMKKTVKLFIQR